MRYYYDTEFLEGKQKNSFPLSLFKKETKPTIDLISIGIVSEDGREYYAISKDFNLKEAWNRWQQRTGEGDRNNIEPRLYWIRENVLKPIFYELSGKDITFHDINKFFTYTNFKKLINKYGKTNELIAEEVKEFFKPKRDFNHHGYVVNYSEIKNPILYGYYSAYDHVVLCWLFGKMIDLPNGFPMHTIDLKQMLDQKIRNIENCITVESFEKHLVYCKNHSNYPKQENAHNALDDAKFNKKLHKFILLL